MQEAFLPSSESPLTNFHTFVTRTEPDPTLICCLLGEFEHRQREGFGPFVPSYVLGSLCKSYNSLQQTSLKGPSSLCDDLKTLRTCAGTVKAHRENLGRKQPSWCLTLCSSSVMDGTDEGVGTSSVLCLDPQGPEQLELK